MPIKLTFERDGRVAIWTYPESFTIAELRDFSDRFSNDILSKAAKRIYVVSDFTAVHHLPPNIMSVGLGMMKKTDPMLGPMIEVTPNEFLNTLAKVLVKVSPSGKITVRRTVTEALEEADRLLALEAHRDASVTGNK